MTASPEPTPARSAPADLRVRADVAGAHQAPTRTARETLADARQGERTLGQLFSDASRDFSTILRSEVALAKLELQAETKTAVAGAVGFVVAGVLGFFALMMLLFAAAYGLFALGLPRWLSFLIVGVVLLVLAGILALVGKSRVGKVGKPERTQRTVKHTVDTLKRAKPHAP
jgi:Putative Actinobacterial Holin-X, holin superfamily III